MEIKAIRQDASMAALVVEQLGNTTEPTVRAAVAAHFAVDEEQKGECSLDFLQGFYSGLYFAQNWFLHATGSKSIPTHLISELVIEAARKYTEQIEKNLSKK